MIFKIKQKHHGDYEKLRYAAVVGKHNAAHV